MSIEHHVPRSLDPDLENDYSNCVYACMRCNRARAQRPVLNASGRRLLNPSHDPWAEHFTAQEGTLRPRNQDQDAAYTYSTYDLDAPEKVELRMFRKRLLEDRWNTLGVIPEMIDELLAEAEACLEPRRSIKLTRQAGQLRQFLKNAREELAWYPAIPPNAPSRCCCTDLMHHCLPSGLASQMIDSP